MEVTMTKLTLMELPVEVRIGILKHVKEESAFRLRRSSSQLRDEIENFYDFKFLYLDDNRPERTAARLKLRIKKIVVESFGKPIEKTCLPLLKHPQAVRKLVFHDTDISLDNYEVLIQECGHCLKQFLISPANLINEEGDFSQFVKSEEHTQQLRNVQRLSLIDEEWRGEDTSKKIMRKRAFIYFLEVALSMSMLKSLTILLRRSLTLKIYLQLRNNIVKLISERFATLEELLLDFTIKIESSEDFENEGNIQDIVAASGNLKRVCKLKKVCMYFEFDGFNDKEQRMAVDVIHLLLNNQKSLIRLEIHGMPVFSFAQLFEIVGRNVSTLEKLRVILNCENICKDKGPIDFSVFEKCLKLKRLLINCNNDEPLKVVNFKLPKSLPRYSLSGFDLGEHKDNWLKSNS